MSDGDDTPRESAPAPPSDSIGRADEPGADSAPAEARGAAILVAFAGLFALIVGLLLRAAVGHEDRSEWNGAVKLLLQVFPLLLIAGGVVVLLWAAVLTTRGRTPTQLG